MRRSEKVEATLTPGEKETLQQLCDEAGCTEAELIRSVLISRSISLDDLETGKKTERVKNKTLQKQGRKHASEKTDERGEAIAEKRDVSFHVMLTAPEKKAIEQRAEVLGVSVSELVRRSAIYGKIESFNFDIAEVEKLYHELLKEGTNLNQLMYFVNAQGLPAYNEKAVFRTLERFIKMLERSTGLSRSLKSVITSIMFHMIIWQMNLTTEIFKLERNWIRFKVRAITRLAISDIP